MHHFHIQLQGMLLVHNLRKYKTIEIEAHLINTINPVLWGWIAFKNTHPVAEVSPYKDIHGLHT